MTERILLLASHAVAEFDDLRMFTDLGYDTFCPGGYEVPGRAPEGIRPPLADTPAHPDLVARLQETRAEYGDPGPLIDAGKARLHPDIIDWADAIIVHHFPRQWIGGQWDRIKHKRVIWRTCGQSDLSLERDMAPYRSERLQIVRYSPAEARYFESFGCFAGEDALIRFGKYPEDYGPWIGDDPMVGNITQDMAKRGDATGLSFWEAATDGLPVRPAGPSSEMLRGGLGTLPYEAMLEYLRHIRAYLYTGTVPASYTLGLIEAMLSGVPVVSIGPKAWGFPLLFEASEIVELSAEGPAEAHRFLQEILNDQRLATEMSIITRERALERFDIATVSEAWQAFLS